MEVSAVHAREVKDPKKNYPRAIFIATILIIIVFFFGALAIAAIIPADPIRLTSGIMEAFAHCLHLFRLDWLLPVVGLLIVLGTIGNISAWIGGPSKGLLALLTAITVILYLLVPSSLCIGNSPPLHQAAGEAHLPDTRGNIWNVVGSWPGHFRGSFFPSPSWSLQVMKRHLTQSFNPK